AEDGIRDGHVTGVQTCALPIFSLVRPWIALSAAAILGWAAASVLAQEGPAPPSKQAIENLATQDATPAPAAEPKQPAASSAAPKIGRASCRERVWSSVVGGP